MSRPRGRHSGACGNSGCRPSGARVRPSEAPASGSGRPLGIRHGCDRRSASAASARRTARPSRSTASFAVDRRGRGPRASRRERRRQVDHGQAPERPGPSRTPARSRSSAKPCRLRGPRAAHGLGIRTAFQEMSLVKDLTVAQNFLLMEEPLIPFGTIRRRQAEATVDANLAAARPRRHRPARRGRRASTCRPGRRSRSPAPSSRNPRILLLDEPTSSLSARDVEWLGGLIDASERRRRHDRSHLAPHAGGARLLLDA